MFTLVRYLEFSCYFTLCIYKVPSRWPPCVSQELYVYYDSECSFFFHRSMTVSLNYQVLRKITLSSWPFCSILTSCTEVHTCTTWLYGTLEMYPNNWFSDFTITPRVIFTYSTSIFKLSTLYVWWTVYSKTTPSLDRGRFPVFRQGLVESKIR